MAASSTYLDYATTQDLALRTGMDHIIGASLTAIQPAVHWLSIVYIIITFCLVASNMLTITTMTGRFVRLLFVVWLVNNVGAYTTYVRNVFFDQVPQAVAATVTGNPTVTTAAQQFDLITMQAENLVGGTQSQITWFTSNGVGDSVSAWIAGFGIELMNGIMFGIYRVGRVLMAVVLCFGPWLLLFELFDRTRGFVWHWVSTAVGLSVFGLGSSILLQINLEGETTMLSNLHGAGWSVDMTIAQLFHVISFLAVDVLAMLGLPAACAVGSGAAIGAAASSGVLGAMLGRGSSVAGKGLGGGFGAARGGAAAISSAVRQGVRSAIRKPA